MFHAFMLPSLMLPLSLLCSLLQWQCLADKRLTNRNAEYRRDHIFILDFLSELPPDQFRIPPLAHIKSQGRETTIDDVADLLNIDLRSIAKPSVVPRPTEDEEANSTAPLQPRDTGTLCGPASAPEDACDAVYWAVPGPGNLSCPCDWNKYYSMLVYPYGSTTNDACGFHTPNDWCGCGGDKSRPTIKCTSRDVMKRFLGDFDLYFG